MNAIPAHLRRDVASRAGNRCEYCRLPRHGQVGPFPIDHIVPRVAGGATAFDNLAFACPHCNGHKWAHMAGIDPVSGDEARLFNPRTLLWDEHFRWSDEDPSTLVGRTAVGRATISRLRMNEATMIAVRGLLRALGTPVL